MLEHIGDVLGASFCQDDVKKCSSFSKLLEIARILWLVSARTQICVLTVCQQQRWQVLEHCANSRIRAGGGTKSVLTADLGVPPLERRPCFRRHDGLTDTLTMTSMARVKASSSACAAAGCRSSGRKRMKSSAGRAWSACIGTRSVLASPRRSPRAARGPSSR